MPAIQSSTNGVFIDACVAHCQTLYTPQWTEIMVGGQNARDTFYYWLTNNTAFSTKEVDCEYPCNPTCTMSMESPSTESPSGAGSNLRLVRQIHIGQAVEIIGFWLLIILY